MGLGLLTQMSPSTSNLDSRQPISTAQLPCVFLHPARPSWLRSATFSLASRVCAYFFMLFVFVHSCDIYIYMCVCVCVCVCLCARAYCILGATASIVPEHVIKNLVWIAGKHNWLDVSKYLVNNWTTGCLKFALAGGVYHVMRQEDVTIFRSLLRYIWLNINKKQITDY